MKLLLIFASLLTISSGVQQVPCERVASAEFTFAVLKVCSMERSTVINASDFTISTTKDETVTGLRLDHNKKISFLPLETAKKFPNLLGYAAHNCSIKVVKNEHFQNLNKLKEIWLAGNRIETIFGDTFDGLISLERINLGKFLIMHLSLIIHLIVQITTEYVK